MDFIPEKTRENLPTKNRGQSRKHLVVQSPPKKSFASGSMKTFTATIFCVVP